MKHGPNTSKNYFDIHEKILSEYTTNHSEEERKYKLKYNGNGTRVTLECHNIIIKTYAGELIRCDITKVAEKNNLTDKIKTIKYSYMAIRYRVKSGELFRYCSPDEDKVFYDPDNHHTFHHKHDFLSGKEKIIQIEDDKWPHISDFFDEVLKLSKTNDDVIYFNEDDFNFAKNIANKPAIQNEKLRRAMKKHILKKNHKMII